MSGSRFVLKQIHVRGAGASDLTRYVAKSKLDAAREGRKPRELFTRTADNLTYSAAREWLSITGGALERRDVLHYVLSFEEEREYEALGDDERERGRHVVAFVRRAVAESLDGIGVAEMRWVAGIHRNTGKPHVHLLLNKNALGRAIQDLLRLPKLPAPVIAHYKTTAGGVREFSYGTFINSFADQVDARHRARVRSLQFENALRSMRVERDLLGPETLSSRQPTQEERLVGRWLLAEIEAARSNPAAFSRNPAGKNPAVQRQGETSDGDAPVSRLGALRAEVARLDDAARAQGQPAAHAFIETEQLRTILVTPPRGLTILTHELTQRSEKLRQSDERAEKQHYAQTLHHSFSAAQNSSAHDTKEQLRPSYQHSRTR